MFRYYPYICNQKSNWINIYKVKSIMSRDKIRLTMQIYKILLD